MNTDIGSASSPIKQRVGQQTGQMSGYAEAPKESKQNFYNDHNKYQSFIYNVMTKIRQVYTVNQRVEILDDQLRTNFRKWLEIANKEHKELMDKNSQIILILDGPENFTDEYGNEQSADWIPLTFPEKFKVIILAKQKCKAMQHFIQRKYPILILKGVHSEKNFYDLCDCLNFDIHEESEFYKKIEEFIQFENKSNIQIISRKKWLKNEAEAWQILARKSDLKKNPTFLTCLLLFKDIFEEIKNSKSIYDLFQRILLHHYEQKSPIER